MKNVVSVILVGNGWGLAILLVVIPFKFFLMLRIVQSFTMTFKISTSSRAGNRRLKEWWASIPIVPVEGMVNLAASSLENDSSS